jgi:hypothetical protein
VKATKKVRVAKERKALAAKRAAIDRLVERMKIGRLIDKRIEARHKSSPLATGSQLRDALAAALKGKPRT